MSEARGSAVPAYRDGDISTWHLEGWAGAEHIGEDAVEFRSLVLSGVFVASTGTFTVR